MTFVSLYYVIFGLCSSSCQVELACQKEFAEKNILRVAGFVHFSFVCCEILIHEADPQSRPVVITIFARVVCPSVLPLFSKSHNTKQSSSENGDQYWQDCGFG